MNDRERNEKADLDQTARQVDEAARLGAVVEVDPDDALDSRFDKEA